MSRSHDLVGVAIGDVRVSVMELSLNERLQLFEAYSMRLSRHYADLRGGSSFVGWEIENFGETLTPHSVRRHSLSFTRNQFPSSSSYGHRTRIFTLASDYFRLPEFEKPTNGQWRRGDTRLVIRLCLTQDGDLYLEWYEGKVVSIEMPNEVLVNVAHYIKLPEHMRLGNSMPYELKKLLETCPSILLFFGHGALSLLASEFEARQRNIIRDKALFSDLNAIGKVFGIRHP